MVSQLYFLLLVTFSVALHPPTTPLSLRVSGCVSGVSEVSSRSFFGLLSSSQQKCDRHLLLLHADQQHRQQLRRRHTLTAHTTGTDTHTLAHTTGDTHTPDANTTGDPHTLAHTTGDTHTLPHSSDTYTYTLTDTHTSGTLSLTNTLSNISSSGSVDVCTPVTSRATTTSPDTYTYTHADSSASESSYYTDTHRDINTLAPTAGPPGNKPVGDHRGREGPGPGPGTQLWRKEDSSCRDSHRDYCCTGTLLTPSTHLTDGPRFSWVHSAVFLHKNKSVHIPPL